MNPSETGIETGATDWESDLGADLGADFGGGSGETAAADPSPSEGDNPQGESVDAPQSGTEDATAQPDQAGTSYQLNEDGSSYIVPKAELPSLTSAKQYADAVQTMFPSSEDAKQAHAAASDWAQFQSDYAYGQNGEFKGLLQYLYGQNHANSGDVQTAQQMQSSFMRLMTEGSEFLRSANPHAHENVLQSIVKNEIDRAYDAAKQSGNPEDLQYAQRLEWGFTGAYRSADQLKQPVQVDPHAARVQELDAREKSMSDTAWKGFSNQNVEGPKWSSFNAEIDKALAPVKDKFDPNYGAYVREQVVKGVIEELQKDSDWAGRHLAETRAIEAAYRQAFKTGQPLSQQMNARIASYRQDFLARVRRFTPSAAAKFTTQATVRKAAPKADALGTATQPRKPQATAAPNGKPTAWNLDDELAKDFAMRR